MIKRRNFLVATAILALAGTTTARAETAQLVPRGGGRIDPSAWDALLKSSVRPDGKGYNRVDYASLSRNIAGLEGIVAAMAAIDPRSLAPTEAHAHWINLYNSLTLLVVARHWPVTSIKKIDLGGNGLFGSGPWKAKLVSVAGVALSLDDIEHEIVRPFFADPMSHYGLNCASYSCPNLLADAYTGENIATLLRRNAGDYVNHPRGVAVRKGRITSSRIYKWYADDFGGKANLKPHWQSLAAPEKAGAIAAADLAGYDYDWSINAA